ncbi:MAG: hypothetical protein NTY03_00630 [Candidatus Bathyarchaeota archaeon]|nr:hypothetical protein [Candidatus Bathyarchaeota archaeon]
MVDLALLQSVSYIAGALGVCIAAFYYAINIREQTRNRRVTLTTSLLQSFMSREGIRLIVDLMRMEWSDFDDFLRKYDSTVNPDNIIMRSAVFMHCEVLGREYRSGVIDLDTLFSVCSDNIPQLWVKFKPIIEEYRKRKVYSKIEFENFEYLAGELTKLMERRDPDFVNAQPYLRGPVK